MTKSIISGLGLLAVVIAILLWLAGLYELTGAGALALGYIGFVLAIFFARFGGFKPFFSAIETVETAETVDTDQKVPASVTTPRNRLVGEGSEADGSEADESESLFGERSPEHTPTVRIGRPIFDEADEGHGRYSPSREPHSPLFGEALSEQLAADRSNAGHLFEELAPEPTPPADDATDFIRSLRDGEKAAEEGDEPGPTTPGVVVDAEPDWVGTDGQEFGSGRVQTEDPDVGAAEVEDGAIEVGETEPDESAQPISSHIADHTTDHSEADVDIDDLDADELAASLDALEPVDPSDTAVEVDYVAEPMVTESTGLARASGTELPVVVENQVPVELHKYSTSEIMSVVKSQEGVLVETLIEEGVLSTSGPITDKDIRTMVFVAVSSNELIDVLTQAQQEAVAQNGGGEHALGTGD